MDEIVQNSESEQEEKEPEIDIEKGTSAKHRCFQNLDFELSHSAAVKFNGAFWDPWIVAEGTGPIQESHDSFGGRPHIFNNFDWKGEKTPHTSSPSEFKRESPTSTDSTKETPETTGKTSTEN